MFGRHAVAWEGVATENMANMLSSVRKCINLFMLYPLYLLRVQSDRADAEYGCSLVRSDRADAEYGCSLVRSSALRSAIRSPTEKLVETPDLNC